MISPDVVWREVGGEIVLLDLRKGRYYGLQDAAALIWKGIARGEAVEAIGRRLLRNYRVTAERAQRDILTLARTLAGKGLVRLR
ncbi:MAG: PqqD family protein [Nitrospirae bacterium]|nr:PqqD family protein [Nitrospirota bacterium]